MLLILLFYYFQFDDLFSWDQPATPPALQPAHAFPDVTWECPVSPRELVGLIGAPIFLESADNLTLVIGQVKGVVGQHVFLGGGVGVGRYLFSFDC